MTLRRFLGLAHKWVTLIIGIQIILWVAGGVVMSFFDIDKVRGAHNVREHEPELFTANTGMLAPGDILARHNLEATRISLRHLLGTPVYEIAAKDSGTLVFDAGSGDRISPVDEVTAIELARQDFAGDDDITSVRLLDEAGYEYRGGPLPAWQIVFADADNTHIYVSADLARVTARRNGTWRFYDFFWMLHIMDYDERDDFNHPLLIIASVIALFGALTGAGLYFYRFTRRDFRWVFPANR